MSNLPTVWMNVLAALWLATGGVAPGLLLLLLLACSAFYSAGMALNDLFDRDVDAQERPERPLPSGRVSAREAAALSGLLLVAGLALLALSPHPLALVPGLGLVGAILLYDLAHKEHPASVVVMAACRFGVFAVCAVAATGGLPGPALVGGALSFVYTLGLSAVARLESSRGGFGFPLIPRLIAGMSLVDGAVLAAFGHPLGLVAGAGATGLTLRGQRRVRGD